FSMRYMLVDGQGNFGSIDDDPPAAMRYTEARLTAIAGEMLVDIDKETVDFVPNFDTSLKEPSVLPARLPNLLVNGSSGIAVGMATNIPPHNLGEVCDAVAYLVDNPEAAIEELMRLVPAPDFPTAGILHGRQGLRQAYETGLGKVVVRARAEIEETKGGRSQIIITELPYQTNKAALMERIAELIKDKKIEGVGDLRDESDRQGMRVVIELKKDTPSALVLNNLFKHTTMQSAFHINMLALVGGQPQVLNLKGLLQYYLDFRRQVIRRRSEFDLKKARERAHILEGLKIALDNLDMVITLIRQSKSGEAARNALMEKFALSSIQAQAILDMQLRRLAGMERQKLIDEYTELLKRISYLEDLLADPKKVDFQIKEDLKELKAKYGDSRRTQIIDEEIAEFGDEDLIPHQTVVISLSNNGYIKRVPVEIYRKQHRSGTGVKGMTTRETDAVRLFADADSHDRILFFTDRGKAYLLKCYEIPQDSTRISKGVPVGNLISTDEKENVTAMVVVKDFAPGAFLIPATARGEVKKTALKGFSAVRSNGIIAMDLEPGDELVAVRLVGEGDEVLMLSRKGRGIRFNTDVLRLASRTSGGVRGMRLEPEDRVVAMCVVSLGFHLLSVTENGYGKRTPVESFPERGRGGLGVKAHRVTPETGDVVAGEVVEGSKELMIISSQGQVIRTSTANQEIRSLSRLTRGVSLMRLDPGDKVVSISCFSDKEDEE
ncbi:MAG: DNA gyrase subunit A, partial [Dehalococcoidia bacterium]|nr:DNA gyrase subunit A [Dehalococcoidia bacterium]